MESQATGHLPRDRSRAAQTHLGDGEGCLEPRRATVYVTTPPPAECSTHRRISAQYESTLIKLANAEVQVEDLKLQLDDALGAEEMLVQLTERNLMLTEVLSSLFCSNFSKRPRQKIEEMRITIEDLEALKELNDELEENHVETEKALQEEIGMGCP